MVKNLFKLYEENFSDVLVEFLEIFQEYEKQAGVSVTLSISPLGFGEVSYEETYLFSFKNLVELCTKCNLLSIFLEQKLNLKNFNLYLSWEIE